MQIKLGYTEHPSQKNLNLTQRAIVDDSRLSERQSSTAVLKYKKYSQMISLRLEPIN